MEQMTGTATIAESSEPLVYAYIGSQDPKYMETDEYTPASVSIYALLTDIK